VAQIGQQVAFDDRWQFAARDRDGGPQSLRPLLLARPDKILEPCCPILGAQIDRVQVDPSAPSDPGSRLREGNLTRDLAGKTGACAMAGSIRRVP